MARLSAFLGRYVLSISAECGTIRTSSAGGLKVIIKVKVIVVAALLVGASAVAGNRPETWFHIIGGNASKAGWSMSGGPWIAPSNAMRKLAYSALWAKPYRCDVAPFLKPGANDVRIEVTSTWFNRLAYDYGQPPELRKTWTVWDIGSRTPPCLMPNAKLRVSGMTGPVTIWE